MNVTNQSLALQSEVLTKASTTLLVFKATATGVIIVLNIFANSLTLIVLQQIRQMNPITRVFMTSMTLSDLGSGFGYILPIFSATLVDRWPFGDVLCVVLGFFNIVFSFSSLMSLLSVNFERFFAVTRPFQYQTLMTVPLALMISSSVWLCAFAMAALNCFMPGRTIYYSPSMHACTTGPIDQSVVDIRGTVFILLFVITPFLLTMAMFLRLFLLARFHASKIAAQERATGKKSDKKAFTTFFIMTVCLSVGWTPIVTVFVYENLTRRDISLWLMCIAQLMAFSNSIMNVLIYYLRNTAFKQAAKRVIFSRIWGNADFETPVITLSTSDH